MVNKSPSGARQAIIRDRFAQQPGVSITELARSGTLADVDVFITDAAAPSAVLKQFARLGPQVLTVVPAKK